MISFLSWWFTIEVKGRNCNLLTKMDENYCFLCQRTKSIGGHSTKSCPNVICKTCGQKGHTVKNCLKMNPNKLEQKEQLSKKLIKVRTDLFPNEVDKPKTVVKSEILQQPRKESHRS